MTIEVLSKPACVQCNQTKKSLRNAGREYTEVNITEDAAAYTLATQELGHMSAPVVIIRDEAGRIVESWAGFQPDKLNAIAA